MKDFFLFHIIQSCKRLEVFCLSKLSIPLWVNWDGTPIRIRKMTDGALKKAILNFHVYPKNINHLDVLDHLREEANRRGLHPFTHSTPVIQLKEWKNKFQNEPTPPRAS